MLLLPPATSLPAAEEELMSTQAEAVTRPAGAYDHLAPLLTRLPQLAADDPDRTRLRHDLAMAFAPLVVNIASRYSGRGEPSEDLEQVGTIGLIGALDRYAPPPGITDPVGAFLGFAVPTVTGEIRRHFRDRAWTLRVPRGIKDLQGPIRDATAALSRRHQRAPRPSEIAAHLGVDLDQVVDALQAQSAYSPDSLDTPALPDGAALADRLGFLDSALEQAEYRHELRAALERLPARERHILILRFFGDMTQTQIGEATGLSQMHVSRLLTRSLATLRRRMGADG